MQNDIHCIVTIKSLHVKNISGTNNSSVFLACNVPIEKYLTQPPNHNATQTEDNVSPSNSNTVDYNRVTISSSFGKILKDPTNTTSPIVTKELLPDTTMTTLNVRKLSTQTAENENKPLNEHIIRQKTKQKTEIKTNIDGTGKHSISGFQMIETYEEEEEWVERSSVLDKYQITTTTHININNIENVVTLPNTTVFTKETTEPVSKSSERITNNLLTDKKKLSLPNLAKTSYDKVPKTTSTNLVGVHSMASSTYSFNCNLVLIFIAYITIAFLLLK